MPGTLKIHNLDNEFGKKLCNSGLVPPWCVRFLIDSGVPGGVVRIFWAGHGEREMLDAIANEVIAEMKKPSHQVEFASPCVRQEFNSEEEARKWAWDFLVDGYPVQVSVLGPVEDKTWVVWVAKDAAK